MYRLCYPLLSYLCLLAHSIIPVDDDQLLREFAHAIDHSQRAQIRCATSIHVEDLLSVPDQATEIAREEDSRVRSLEAVAQHTSIVHHLLPLHLDLAKSLLGILKVRSLIECITPVCPYGDVSDD